MRRIILAIVAANVAVLVALSFLWPEMMVSPGPLIPAHAELTTDCFGCHTPLLGARVAKCTSCHKPEEVGLKTSKGVAISRTDALPPFHQSLMQQDCLACHSDHPPPRLTQSAQVRFAHALLAPERATDCVGCHTAPVDRNHTDPRAQCSGCHGQTAWKPATLDHSRYFVLDRDHNATCSTCHTEPDYKVYTCYGCHEHTPAKIRREHEGEGIRDYENCVACHRNARDEPRFIGGQWVPGGGETRGRRNDRDADDDD